MRKELINELNNLFDNMLAKYDAGAEEHKSDPNKIDYDKEIYDEAMDILIYLMMKKICRTKNVTFRRSSMFGSENEKTL